MCIIYNICLCINALYYRSERVLCTLFSLSKTKASIPICSMYLDAMNKR